jgi:hypothetical protein
VPTSPGAAPTTRSELRLLFSHDDLGAAPVRAADAAGRLLCTDITRHPRTVCQKGDTTGDPHAGQAYDGGEEPEGLHEGVVMKCTATRVVIPIAGGLAVLGTVALQPAQAEGGLTAARAISAHYQSEDRAIADGFARTDHCVAAPELGGMGYHYVNVDRVDTRLEPGRPEVVLYRDGANGERVLTGIEYVVVDRDQDLSTDDDRPRVWGHDFDGPMPGHEPGMPVHYDLHVWAWEENPDGAWATWNRNVHC